MWTSYVLFIEYESKKIRHQCRACARERALYDSDRRRRRNENICNLFIYLFFAGISHFSETRNERKIKSWKFTVSYSGWPKLQQRMPQNYYKLDKRWWRSVNWYTRFHINLFKRFSIERDCVCRCQRGCMRVYSLLRLAGAKCMTFVLECVCLYWSVAIDRSRARV